MKSILKINIILLLVLTLSTACNDYLDTLPDNRTELDSPESVGELLVSAYHEASSIMMAETMSDNASLRSEKNPNIFMGYQLYNWEEDINSSGQDSPDFFWMQSYKAISACNVALQKIKENGGGREYDPYKGEALIARAYHHFMLLNFFSKSYNKNTASQDLGIPYVTEVEDVVFKEYKRGNVQTVCDSIVRDFEQGILLLENQRLDVPKYHFNKAAACAFGSRLYLYLQDWDKTIKYSNMVLQEDASSQLRGINTEYKTMTYFEMVDRYNHTSENANLLVGSKISSWGNVYWVCRYGLGNFIAEQTFKRKTIVGKPWAHLLAGDDLSYNFPKYKSFFKSTSSTNVGIRYTIERLLTTEEVLFNRAEAYVMKNKSSLALNDINAFLSTRIHQFEESDKVDIAKIQNYYSQTIIKLNPDFLVSFSQTNLLKCVLDLKRIEFLQDGMRWFDVKRYNIVVRHFDGSMNTLNEKDPRRELQIPLPAINQGIKKNPR